MIHEAWFTFKGIDSREMGVIVTAMPETVRAERRIESITVAGRNGSLHTDEGVYESYDRTMECALIKRAKLDEVTAWLVGSGGMTFSTEPDKVYRVTIANKITASLRSSEISGCDGYAALQIQRQCRRGCFRADRPDHHPQQRHSLQRTAHYDLRKRGYYAEHQRGGLPPVRRAGEHHD